MVRTVSSIDTIDGLLTVYSDELMVKYACKTLIYGDCQFSGDGCRTEKLDNQDGYHVHARD